MSLSIADIPSDDFAIEHLHAPVAQYIDLRPFHQFDASVEMAVKPKKGKLSFPNGAKTQGLRLIILAL